MAVYFPKTGKQVVPLSHQDILQEIVHTLLPEFDGMPAIPISIKQDPYFNDTLSLAVYRGGGPHGYIVVRPDYHARGRFVEIVNTIRHELIHAWVSWKGLKNLEYGGHGEAFIKKAIELNLDLSSVFHHYPQTREIYDRLKGEPETTAVTPRVPKPVEKPSEEKRGSDWFLWLCIIIGFVLFGLFVELLGIFFTSSDNAFKAGIAWGIAFLIVIPIVALYEHSKRPDPATDEELFKNFPTYFCLVVMLFCVLFGLNWGDSILRIVLMGILGITILFYVPACDVKHKFLNKTAQNIYHWGIRGLFMVLGVMVWFKIISLDFSHAWWLW